MAAPSSRLLLFFFFWGGGGGVFSFSTDRPIDPKSGNGFHSKQKKVNGLRGSTSKQHTINLVPRAFSTAWEGKRLWTKVKHTVILSFIFIVLGPSLNVPI